MHPASILLVEGEVANLLVLKVIFADLGENLFRASSGEEELALLDQDDFSMALLDVRMRISPSPSLPAPNASGACSPP